MIMMIKEDESDNTQKEVTSQFHLKVLESNLKNPFLQTILFLIRQAILDCLDPILEAVQIYWLKGSLIVSNLKRIVQM